MAFRGKNLQFAVWKKKKKRLTSSRVIRLKRVLYATRRRPHWRYEKRNCATGGAGCCCPAVRLHRHRQCGKCERDRTLTWAKRIYIPTRTINWHYVCYLKNIIIIRTFVFRNHCYVAFVGQKSYYWMKPMTFIYQILIQYNANQLWNLLRQHTVTYWNTFLIFKYILIEISLTVINGLKMFIKICSTIGLNHRGLFQGLEP